MENASATPLAGYATPEDTYKFKQRFELPRKVAIGHYKKTATGHWLSSVGMGTYLGDPTTEVDKLVITAAIESVSSGAMNVLDTASNYRYQKAERALGQALQTLVGQHGVNRSELFLSSKSGFLTPDGDLEMDFRTYFQKNFIESGIVRQEDVVANMHCMAPTFLNHQLNQSLKNLGVETLDLIYLHNAAESQLPAVGEELFMERLEEVFRFYEMARTKNKIRYYGMATWDCFRVSPNETHYLNLSALVKMAQKIAGDDHGFRFVQLPYNVQMNEACRLKNQEVGGKAMTLMEAAQSLGIGVFVSVPLLQGRLLKYEMQVPVFPALETKAQHCLQYVRSTAGVISALVGHKRPEHVRENIQVATISPITPTIFEAKYAPARV